MERVDESGRVLHFKDVKYELLHTGGFLRLCTKRGRIYWNAQNETEHTSPDWKIHFSVEMADIPKAWNVLAALFMDMRCEIGMKAVYLEPSEWSAGQRGREITVYSFCHHHSYKGYAQGMNLPGVADCEVFLGSEIEVYGVAFWTTFVREAEERLVRAGVRSRGCADGDLHLPGCHFASLRNEAFVFGGCAKRQLEYPPNACGWNAAKHPNPWLELIFVLHQLSKPAVK